MNVNHVNHATVFVIKVDYVYIQYYLSISVDNPKLEVYLRVFRLRGACVSRQLAPASHPSWMKLQLSP